MSHNRSQLAKRRCAFPLSRFSTPFLYIATEFLQERVTLETSRPDFSSLPFRFAEIAKVILDVLVLCHFLFECVDERF